MSILGQNVGNIHHGFTQANSSVSVHQGLACLGLSSRTEPCMQKVINLHWLNDPCIDYCFGIWKLSRRKMTSWQNQTIKLQKGKSNQVEFSEG